MRQNERSPTRRPQTAGASANDDAEALIRLASAQWAALLAVPAARAELEAEDAFWDRLVGDGLTDERWPM